MQKTEVDEANTPNDACLFTLLILRAQFQLPEPKKLTPVTVRKILFPGVAEEGISENTKISGTNLKCDNSATVCCLSHTRDITNLPGCITAGDMQCIFEDETREDSTKMSPNLQDNACTKCNPLINTNEPPLVKPAEGVIPVARMLGKYMKKTS